MQILTSRKITRRTIWLRRVGVVGLVVLLAGAWFAYQPVKNRYKIWKQQRALVQAKDFIEQQDYPAPNSRSMWP